MPENARSFLLFRTELFLYSQEEDQIDQWFVGGDCAGWLYARLLPMPQLEHACGPVMEDWGWYLQVQVTGPLVSVALLVYPSFERENCWVVGLDAQQGWFRRKPATEIQQALNRVADGLEQIIAADDRLEFLSWYEEFPG